MTCIEYRPQYTVIRIVIFALVAVCPISSLSMAREVLPPIAYFNRTMYPPLVLYQGTGEQLRTTAKIQSLQNELDFELASKNDARVKYLTKQINRWETLRNEDEKSANAKVEAEDGPLPPKPLLSLGIVSDIQYAPKEEEKRRHFKLSKGKLQHAISEMKANRSHLDLLMNLGDTVDDTIAVILPEIMPIFQQMSPLPVHHVLGNHDFLGTNSRNFDTLHTLLGMPARYYALDVKSGVIGKDGGQRQFRLIILDSNDLAIYSTDVGSEKRRQAEAMLGLLKRRRAKNAQIFNGALGNPQIEWLKNELKESCEQGKLVLVFLHHPMRPKNEPTNLWNDVEVVPIIAGYGCVLAVVNGHAHKLLYDYQHTRHRDVHFITYGGMVQSPFTSWGFLDVFEDHLRVHGLIFGRPIDYSYDISDKSQKYHQVGDAEVTGDGKARVVVSSAPETGRDIRETDKVQLAIMESQPTLSSSSSLNSKVGEDLVESTPQSPDKSDIDLLTAGGYVICGVALVVALGASRLLRGGKRGTQQPPRR